MRRIQYGALIETRLHTLSSPRHVVSAYRAGHPTSDGLFLLNPYLLITELPSCRPCSWMTVTFSVKSLESGTLVLVMPYGIQIQGGCTLLYEWATSASFAGVVFTVCSMLYFRGTLSPIQTLTVMAVWCIPRNWNPRYRNIFAGIETTTKTSARGMLPKSILDITSMP